MAPGAAPATTVTTATTAPVQVRLDELSPTVVRPGQDLRVQVTVSATAGSGTGPLTARVLTGASAVTGREELASWLHDSSPRPLAGRVATTQQLPAGLPGGGSTTLSLTVPRSQLSRGAPFGAYPLAVEVRSAEGQAGIARTVVPWVGRAEEFEPLRLAWVAPLTLPADPELTAGTDQQVGAAWTRAVGPGGPLQHRLDAASGTPVTWLVDPAVVAPPTRAGGLVTASSPEPAPSLSTPATPSTPTSPTNPTTPALPTPGATSSRTGASSPATSAGSAATAPAAPATPGTAAPSTPSPAPPAASTPAALAGAARDAQQLAARLKALGDDQPLWGLPTHDPDTAALLDSGLDDRLREVLYPSGASPLDAPLGRSLPSSVAWPADGRWDTDRSTQWPLLTGHGAPTAALVSSATVASWRGTTPGAAQRSAGGLPLLAYDERLSAVTAGTRTASDAQLVQEFLGQSLTLLGELPGTRRTALVTIPRDTAMSGPALRRLWTASGTAPWLRQVATSSILGQSPDASGPATGSPHVGVSPLDAERISALEQDAATASGLAQVLPPEQVSAGSWTTGVRDLASARWRGQPGSWETLRHAVTGSLSGTAQGIQVRPSTINFLADTGTIQITVTNALPYAVHGVRLELVPGSPKLRVDRSPGPISVAAGSRTTTQVQVTALGAGTVPLEARLTTPDGTVLGVPTTVDMNVRPTSVWVFVLIAGIVGAILVLGLARSLRRSPTRAQRELGDTHAVADAVLGPHRSPKDLR
ncbi:hypothetical protein ADJ73_05320 [Arsenicicoccus sp. oral taxon 190]|nr:hypothetical protein ADJ73_05320 [Arsenicicoccus sp. oral taxon 190]